MNYIILLAFMIFFLSSCIPDEGKNVFLEQEYTCSCDIVDISTGKRAHSYSKTEAFTSRSEAEAWCDGDEVYTFGYQLDCHLE